MTLAALGYENWADHFVGLAYEREVDLVYYRPVAPFTVDGVQYPVYRPTGHARRILELFEDGDSGGAYMCCSSPPTEDELDVWVRTGRLNGRWL